MISSSSERFLAGIQVLSQRIVSSISGQVIRGDKSSTVNRAARSALFPVTPGLTLRFKDSGENVVQGRELGTKLLDGAQTSPASGAAGGKSSTSRLPMLIVASSTKPMDR